MSNNYRELTGREKQRIKKLVTSLCANYDKEYGCLRYRGPQKVIRLFGERRSSGVNEFFVLARKRVIQSLWRRVTVQCWESALPTAHYADISASLSCRKIQRWKPYSRKHQPLTANNAASHSQLTENGCTAHSAAPKKLAVSRPQQGCVSTEKNNNRCDAFALGKPCAAKLFWGHFCIGRVLIPFARF